MSILGLWQWDNNLFANLALPDGLDKQSVIDNILAECAELEALYTSPEFMSAIIGVWSNKELPVWSKLYATTQYEYEPIFNYDRTEEETISRDTEGTSNASTTSKGTNLEQVAAFNSSELQDSNQVDSEATTSGSGSNTENEDVTRKLRSYGNIGVTTTQQMIEAERKVVQFNIIDHIVESFKHRFCLMVY